MTTPSDTRDSELVARARELAGAIEFSPIGARKMLRRLADTIDRLTSTGEAVAYRTNIFENLPNGKLTRLILDAAEVKDPDPDWKPLVYASPREGHVEVPVEPTEVLWIAFSMEYAVEGYENFAKAYRAMLSALPNQGETKP